MLLPRFFLSYILSQLLTLPPLALSCIYRDTVSSGESSPIENCAAYEVCKFDAGNSADLTAYFTTDDYYLACSACKPTYVAFSNNMTSPPPTLLSSEDFSCGSDDRVIVRCDKEETLSPTISPPSPSPSPAPTMNPTEAPTPTPLDLTPIIGGASGGVVFVLALILFYVWKGKAERKAATKKMDTQDSRASWEMKDSFADSFALPEVINPMGKKHEVEMTKTGGLGPPKTPPSNPVERGRAKSSTPWQMIMDVVSNRYYFKKGERTTWTPPGTQKAEAAPRQADKKGAKKMKKAGGTGGWTKKWDSNSQAYYFENSVTGVTQWEKPDVYTTTSSELASFSGGSGESFAQL